MELIKDFFNIVAKDLRTLYFPNVAFYRDDKNCEKATYSLELFSNGCLTYTKLISSLSKHCKADSKDIKSIVDKYITF